MKSAVLNYFVRSLAFIIVVLALVACTGCASIVDGGPGELTINSMPTQASVKVLDKSGKVVASGQTPCYLKLERGSGYFGKASYTIQVEKEGHLPQQTELSSHLNAGWYLGGNLLFGGLIGWLVVDPISGAMWDLDKNRIDIVLAKQATSPDPIAQATSPAPIPQATQDKFCPSCGHKCKSSIKFCPMCGGGISSK